MAQLSRYSSIYVRASVLNLERSKTPRKGRSENLSVGVGVNDVDGHAAKIQFLMSDLPA